MPADRAGPHPGRSFAGQRRVLGSTAMISLTVVAADALSKHWAESSLPGHPRTLGFLTLRLTHNTGVAFSIGAGGSRLLVLAATAAVVLLVAVAAMRNRLPVAPAALVIGGGLANLLDRLPDGRVTDFLDLRWWPVFNGADTAIVLGAGLLAFFSLVEQRRVRRSPGPGSGDAAGLSGPASIATTSPLTQPRCE